MIAVLAAVLSGALFYLSQGLDDLWFLAWFAPVPILWLAYGKTPWWQVMAASLVAYLAGEIYAVQCYGMLPPIVLLAVVGPLTVAFLLAVAFGRVVYRRIGTMAALFAFPAAYTALEFLFTLVLPNGTYGSLAYSQMSAPFAIQTASLLGMFVITFLITLSAGTLAIAIRQAPGWKPAAGMGAALCILAAVFGFVRLAEAPQQTVRVAAFVDETAMMQAYHGHTEAAAVGAAQTYADAIRAAAAHGAKLAVMPEGGLLARPDWRDAVLAPLRAAAKDTGIEIVVGLYVPEPAADLALSLRPDGSVRTYAKRHMVPIVETFPPGTQSGWLGDGRGMEICKDMDFPQTIRPDAARGIRLMSVPAGDFGTDAWLHARIAILRGVENGFAEVRAANEGLLTASDAQGRLVASKMAAPAGMTTILADLPLGPGPTLYARTGDVFAWLCVAAALAMAGWLLLAKRKKDPSV